MNLSERTLKILQNFAAINPNMVFKSGNVLKTISNTRTVIGSAVVDEEFPKDFGIYDLGEFLNVLTLVDCPEIEFHDKHVRVLGGVGGFSAAADYHYSDMDMLLSPFQKKDIEMPETEISFVLNKNEISRIKKAAGVLGHEEISITPSDKDVKKVKISVINSRDATSNVFSIDVDAERPPAADFKFFMLVNNIKVLDEDFEVGVSSKLISHWKSLESKLEYYVALEKSSSYSNGE